MSVGAPITAEDPGAFVSSMIARRELPILMAFRHEPLDELDSGWQFTAGEHDDMEAPRLWLLSKVLEMEPSLAPFMDLEGEVTLGRELGGVEWFIRQGDDWQSINQ